MSEYITIGDCAAIFQGRNLDKAKLNTEGKGIPYIVGASCMKDARLKCEKYCENFENETISKLGDILVSTVGTLGKVAINDIGDCVLSRHVCAVRFVPEYCPNTGCCASWHRLSCAYRLTMARRRAFLGSSTAQKLRNYPWYTSFPISSAKQLRRWCCLHHHSRI